MAFSSNNNDSLMGEINVTPLVDVMLVLLIIFMIAAPLVQQQVDVELPVTESKKSVAVEEKDIVLVVNSKKQIFIESNQIKLSELQQKLDVIFKNKAKKEIFLQADKTIPYGYVVKVMALVKNAGVDKMGMITENQERK